MVPAVTTAGEALAIKGEVEGIQAVIRAIGKEKAETGKKMDVLVKSCAEVVLRKALTLIPRKTGAAAASGKITVTGQGFGAKGTVSFGGPDTPYVIYLHENVEARHASPTQAKFLEAAVRLTKGTCASIMRRTVITDVSSATIKTGEAGL